MKAVVEVPTGVAVVAEHFWAAKKGRAALEIDWDLGPGAAADSEALWAQYRELGGQPGLKAAAAGDAAGALAAAASAGRGRLRGALPGPRHHGADELHRQGRRRRLRDLDRHPVPDHGPGHAPPASSASSRSRCRSTPSSWAAASAAGPPRTRTSSARRSRWPRPRGCRSRWCGRARTTPAAATTGRWRCTASGPSLGPDGVPAAWRQTIVCQSLLAGTPFEAMMVHDGIDATAVEGAADSPYLKAVAEPPGRAALAADAGPHPLVALGGQHPHRLRHRELRRRAGARRRSRTRWRTGGSCWRAIPRHLGVLDLAAEKAGWGTPLAARAGSAAWPFTTPSAASSPRWRRSRSRAATSASTASSAPSTAGSRSTRPGSRRRWSRPSSSGCRRPCTAS